MLKVSGIGHLGSDPEINTVRDTKVANVSVACNNRRTDATTWVRLACWGGLATVVEDHLAKGKKVYFDGDLQVREYKRKDGTDGYSLEVNVNGLEILSPKEDRSPVWDQDKEPAPASDNPDDETYDPFKEI